MGLAQILATHIRVTFSTFIAGKSVKVLIAKQEITHAMVSKTFERTKDVPRMAGHIVPKMNSPVKISR
ncbi:hypothetical protein Trco_004221 [Trichoderma cornu-damae]|uniref:Uncharacterized protein n=1 Tax=Trichoderma cornu-damae TaxID=654480 RepID=A0A9P8QRH6_9HYPO|nr:hypothetical protein Trco_004221 [Trichoderma cornu-damae]